MGRHPRALLTLSQSNGIGSRPNILVSELIRHDTRAVEASDVASTLLGAKTSDEAIVTKRADP